MATTMGFNFSIFIYSIKAATKSKFIQTHGLTNNIIFNGLSMWLLSFTARHFNYFLSPTLLSQKISNFFRTTQNHVTNIVPSPLFLLNFMSKIPHTKSQKLDWIQNLLGNKQYWAKIFKIYLYAK